MNSSRKLESLGSWICINRVRIVEMEMPIVNGDIMENYYSLDYEYDKTENNEEEKPAKKEWGGA